MKTLMRGLDKKNTKDMRYRLRKSVTEILINIAYRAQSIEVSIFTIHLIGLLEEFIMIKLVIIFTRATIVHVFP